MVETLRIEIPIETIDNTDPELSNLIKKMGKLGEEAEKTGKKTKKSSQYVTEFDKQAGKTEKSLAAWAKEKYQVLLEAKERISPVLSKLGGGLRSFAGKTWSVTMRAVDLVTSPVRGIINLLKNPVFQVGAVLGVSIGLKDTIDTYKDFEAAMSQVKAISGATGSDMVKLTDKAKAMGATTKFTAEESAGAFNYMAMAGWKTGDMLDGIEGILSLAAASGEDLATTSDIVTDALTAFGMKASDAGLFSDVLAAAASSANTNVSMMGETFKYAGSMAGTLGYSIGDVALMTGLMANAGIKGTMAGTALNAVFTRLSTNTSGAADVMSELGVEFFDASGNARDLSDVMSELRLATEQMNAQEKSGIANAIAGMEAQKGLLAILNASEEDYTKLAEAIENADGAAAEMSDTMMDNLSGSLIRLQSAVDGVKVSFGERLSPYVRGIADWLTGQMPVVEQGLDDFMDWLDRRIDRMQRKFAAIADTEEWQDADFLGRVKIAWDEFIANPFSEWWNSTGKAKFAGFAQDIGSGIGTGLKLGIMTLLGIDIGETLDAGVSIGASFAKGFSEGFDFEAVSEKLWTGFGNLLSNAGKFLPGGAAPDLSSVFSAVMLGKIAGPLFSIGRGGFSIGKGIAKGVPLMKSLIGSTGNAMMQGTGLLNVLASAGYKMTGGAASAGGYFGAGTAMSGGAAAAVGAAGIAGAAAAGATLVSSALDAYKAIKSDNKGESKAYRESAAWKAGGVAAGAAIGTVILPGLGTAIGAGIGGIAGWIKGSRIKADYQKNVEEMEKEAEKARKVFAATGRSIEEVTFKNNLLTQAMNDTEVSAEQLALMIQEECAAIAKEAFGDIKLSLEEIKKVAAEITFADMVEELDEFSGAAADTEAAFGSLQSSAAALKKETWKVGLGMELSETDKDGYKNAIDAFISKSRTYINDNHYEATAALNLLSGDSADTAVLNGYYDSLKQQLEGLGGELTEYVTIALEDSVITLDERKELESLQAQITEITTKLADARTEAELQTLKIKHNGAALDYESFTAMLEEFQAGVKAASEQYEDALTLTITNLNLQLADGAITQEAYQEAVETATENYYLQIDNLDTRVRNFSLESIAEAYRSRLDGILPELEGTTEEKLSQAMDFAVLAHPDVAAWNTKDVAAWFGLDKLNLGTEEQETIAKELKATALAVPEGSKEILLQEFRKQVPTVEEIKAAIDWDNLTNNQLNEILEDAGLFMMDGGVKQIEMPLDKWAEVWGQSYEEYKNEQAELIRSSLENSRSGETLSLFMEQYMKKPDSMMSRYGPVSNSYYDMMGEQAAKELLENGASAGLLGISPSLRTGLQISLDEAVSMPYYVSPTVYVVPDYDISALPVRLPDVSAHAAGGYVEGGPQLSWLAEEGYGEFIIPTNPGRRSRALDLYAQAGAALGVSAHADGGYVGSPVSGNVSGWEEKNYESGLPAGRSGNAAPVKVSVNVAPEFVIHGSAGQSEEDIMQVIRRHMREMADELGGEIAGKLEEVFSNMPLKEA